MINRRRYGGKDNWLVCTYYGNDSEETKIISLANVTSYVRKIKIDGVVQSVAQSYQLSEGEHTVEILLRDRKKIATDLFRQLPALTDVILPKQYKKIGQRAFLDCKALKNINLDNVQEIGDGAFWGCDGLTTVILGENIKTLGYNAFLSCKNLQKIYIYFSNVVCGGSLAQSCSNLTDAYIYGSNNDFGIQTFSGSDKLERIHINSLYDYCTNVFRDSGQARSFTGKDKHLLLNETEITGTLYIPEGITSLEGNFQCVSSFSNVVFPEGFTTLGQRTFKNCIGMDGRVFTFPESINYIGMRAIQDSKIAIIKFEANIPPVIDDDDLSSFFNRNVERILVPRDAVDVYKNAWQDVQNKIICEDDIKNVEYLGITAQNSYEWIDTGVKGNLNTEIGVTFYAENAQFPVMGFRNGDNNITIWCNSTQQSDQRFGAWSVKKGFVYGEKYIVSINKDELIINGDSTSVGYSTPFETDGTIRLYSVTKSHGKGRICSAYIKQNGQLILDLHPVSVGGIGWFKDTISGKLLTLNGDNTFEEIGPEI